MPAYEDELKRIEKERQSQSFGSKQPQQSNPMAQNMGKSADNVAAKKASSGGMTTTNKAVAGAQIAQASGALGEQGTTDEGGGAMQGAASGAAMGASFGPYGAAIGAVAGGIMGAAGARGAAKAQNAAVEQKKHQALAKIEEEKGRKISDALHQMGSRMSIR